MKKSLVLSLGLVAGGVFSAAAEEWTGRFPDEVVPLKVSIVKPIQIPIPWYGYYEEVGKWGSYTVTGIDLGLESDTFNLYGLAVTGLAWGGQDMMGLDVAVTAIRKDVYGLQVGGGACATGALYGWQLGAYTLAWNDGAYGLQTGILNMAGKVRGVQIGVANTAKDLQGVQIGLLNFNFGGPLTFFPIANAAF